MRKYKILIVEDDRQLAELAKMSFPADQFIVKIADTGESALEEIGKSRPDLIVLDLILPKMDGWAVLEKLKSESKTSSIPVVVCTGRDEPDDIEKSFQYGAQAYIIKPLNFGRLIRKVAAILDIEKLLSELKLEKKVGFL